ncbi:MAG: hypothetical protein ACK40G_04385 [Cytophagaceae bacterium]
MIDSLYLYQRSKEIVNSRKLSYIREVFSYHLFSSHFHDTILSIGGALNENLTSNTQFYLRYYHAAFTTFFSYGFPGDSLDLCESMIVRYNNFHDSLLVSRKYYYQVKEFEILIYQGGILPRKVFYAPNIGIIRKENFDGSIWNLKRYNVIN